MQSQKNKRMSGSISGAAGVYFVAGELSRLGYIALPTIRNTEGIDLVVSDMNSSRTVYLQVKTNKDKYDFWIVGSPKSSENLFYIFVNLLKSHKNHERPEYYIVPSKDVYQKFQDIQSSKKYEDLTTQEKEKIADAIKDGKSAWRIVEELRATVNAVRRIAKEKELKIKYDRGKGEEFPFSFAIRKEDESKYKDRWELLFNPHGTKLKGVSLSFT